MKFNPKFEFVEMLKKIQAENGQAGIHLRSGQFLSGKVSDVAEHYFVISELTGKEFYDAQIAVGDVCAIETKIR